MKRKVMFFLLLFATSLSLAAHSKQHTNDALVLQDSIKGHMPKLEKLEKQPTDSIKKISYSASTLLDADGVALDTSVVKLPNTYAWTIDPRFGDRTLTAMDTVRINFHRSTLAEGEGIAMSHLGNIGGVIQHKEFFARAGDSQFPFMDVFSIWRRTPEKQLFLNTKIPYSNVQYQAGGGKQMAENRFKAELSSNFGKRFNAGFNFDYIYARGFYKSQFNKQTSFDVNASYIGDRYKFHIFAGTNSLQASDNGGITDTRYITSPESEGLEAIRGGSLDIPVVFENGIKNKLRGGQIYMTNSYDIGKDQELVQVNDTTSVWRRKENYIAPASVILTTHYQDQRRTITSGNTIRDLDSLNYYYVPNILDKESQLPIVDRNGIPQPIYTDALKDYMSHYTFTNTLAFRMNEGFREWTKFSLTAFVEHEMRRFLIPDPHTRYMNSQVNEDVFFFGGKLSKNQGKHLRFDINAFKGINTNDMELEGNVKSTFSLFDKEFSLSAKGYFKNHTPNFFQENFSTRNISFRDMGFKDTQRFYLGGEVALPSFSFSETTLSGGYENISNYIYLQDTKIPDLPTNKAYDTHRRKPTQSTKNINIVALKFEQKLHAGIFHLELRGLVQKTTEDDVIPLPLWTAYGNAYLQTKVSKVLTVQIGVDGYMHAKYYAPRYDVLFGQFYNQRKEGGEKIGHFPHANAYINLHLKYTRIFLMMYNVAEAMGNRQSFTTPRYPVDPMMFRWGLSWKFNN